MTGVQTCALPISDDARFDDTVTVLYNEALIAEGYKTEPEFLAAINRLLAFGGSAAPKKKSGRKNTDVDGKTSDGVKAEKAPDEK